jgi:hypothetical protein
MYIPDVGLVIQHQLGMPRYPVGQIVLVGGRRGKSVGKRSVLRTTCC